MARSKISLLPCLPL